MVVAETPPQLVATAHSRFIVAARRLILPDTSVDFAWAEGRIDVIGPMTVARPTRYQVGTPVVLLALDPIVASAWLGTPLDLLTDRVVDLRDIDAGLAGPLAERFAGGEVRDLVSLAPAKPVGAAARAEVAASLLRRGARIAETAEGVNLEERQFSRWFHRLFGMNPKRFQRIIRLRQAMIEAKRGAALATAAAGAGYADQAHFSREARSLAGGSPKIILPNVGNVQDFGSPIG